MPRADDEIVDRAAALQTLAERQVTLVTGDFGMATRARLAGLRTRLLEWPEPQSKNKRSQEPPA